MLLKKKCLLTAPLLAAGLTWAPASVLAADGAAADANAGLTNHDAHRNRNAMGETRDLPPLVGQARADLSQRLGVEADAIEVSRFDETEWPDASLGLPEEGQVYAQTITPGHRVTFWYNGRPYEYHTGGTAFRAVPEYDPAQVGLSDFGDANREWDDRLVSVEGQLYPYDDSYRLSTSALRGNDNTWIAGESSVEVQGNVLNDLDRGDEFTDPLPMRAWGYVRPYDDGREGRYFDVVRYERLEGDQWGTQRLNSPNELVTNADRYRDRSIELTGRLHTGPEGAYLQTEGADAQRIWVDYGDREFDTAWTREPVTIRGIYAARGEGQEGFGPEGQFRYRISAADISSANQMAASNRAGSNTNLEAIGAPDGQGSLDRQGGQLTAEGQHGLMRNGLLYVPLRSVAQAANLRLSFVPTKNAVDIYDTVDRAGSELIARIRVGERKFHTGKAIPNGNIPMDGAPLMIGGQLYVPASFINRILQSPMVGDPTDDQFRVQTDTYTGIWRVTPETMR